jgi:hypothetical protein
MIVDTLAARLHHSINHYREYHRYERGYGRRARIRLVKKLTRLTEPESYIRYEQMFQAGVASLDRVQRFLDTAVHVISRIELPLHFAFSLLLTTGLKIVSATLAFVLVVAIWNTLTGPGFGSVWSTLFEYLLTLRGVSIVVNSRWYFAYLVIVGFVFFRQIVDRLQEKRRADRW